MNNKNKHNQKKEKPSNENIKRKLKDMVSKINKNSKKTYQDAEDDKEALKKWEEDL